MNRSATESALSVVRFAARAETSLHWWARTAAASWFVAVLFDDSGEHGAC
jgi:hypothetical protein